MSSVGPIGNQLPVAPSQRNLPRVSDQAAAAAAHTAITKAVAQVAAAKGRGDASAIATAEQLLAGLTATAISADARLNVTT